MNQEDMIMVRNAQVGLFFVGTICLLAAIPFAGGTVGDILWRAGIATLLVDIVAIKLWPGEQND